MQRMNAREFRKKFNYTGGFVDGRIGAKNTRSASALCADDSKAKIRKQAMEAIRDLQGCCPTNFFDSSVKLTVDVHAKTKADYDNIFKGIADSLQGFAYRNDKQVRGAGEGRIHDC